jgi:hypothetical protein
MAITGGLSRFPCLECTYEAIEGGSGLSPRQTAVFSHAPEQYFLSGVDEGYRLPVPMPQRHSERDILLARTVQNPLQLVGAECEVVIQAKENFRLHGAPPFEIASNAAPTGVAGPGMTNFDPKRQHTDQQRRLYRSSPARRA